MLSAKAELVVRDNIIFISMATQCNANNDLVCFANCRSETNGAITGYLGWGFSFLKNWQYFCFFPWIREKSIVEAIIEDYGVFTNYYRWKVFQDYWRDIVKPRGGFIG